MSTNPLKYTASLLYRVISAVYLLIIRLTRPIVKWGLRRTTGLCELQRICYCEPNGAIRIFSVEECLSKSKNKKIKKLSEYLERAVSEKRFNQTGSNKIISNTVETICSIKNIRPDVHQPFGKLFGDCVSVIYGYKQLLNKLEDLKSTKYDSTNLDHEQNLLELWDSLMSPKQLQSRISNLWKEIGFQGDDPSTDFRGMGVLGLANLNYLANNYKDVVLQVLSHSHHPKYGYPFAIVGINLTHLSYSLWKDGSAKSHVYNLCCQTSSSPVPSILHFHRFYCYLFVEFDKYWMAEKPSTIMEFERIRAQFEKNIRKLLSNRNCLLKLNIPVENV
uniref:EOG090X0AMT n=1 Tax=Scapholeberis mucronata TaxID=202097 RepID=A0A4Y7NMG1_9CRUS|nr:EOG090X0AMT [Scapholeberis mucronata]SVE93786.1 EOG090X0AMT [Scapholeberis mucronata]